MNNIYQHYLIDLSSNSNFVQIPTVQGDGNNTRGFEVELIENGVQYEIDKDDCVITIMGTKPDTSQIMNDCKLTDNGYILVDITSQMSAVKGRGDYQIVLMSKSTNSQLKSFPFHILTTPATFDVNHITSSDEFQFLTRNIVRVEMVIEEANDTISDMRDLEKSVTEAEKDRVDAEEKRANAENTRISNEDTRQINEATRQDNETIRKSSEDTRQSNESDRQIGETARTDAENIRIANEETRETNEAERIKAETDRIHADADRSAAEEDRITSENTRKFNEDVRKASEEDRINAELIRNETEGTRNNAENIRMDNESDRQTNESIREANESERQINTAIAISNAEEAANRANAAAEKANQPVEGVDYIYQQATGYTDQKIADLINGAPSTLDTLGEIAQAMQTHEDVVEALDAAIGTKANQAEMESWLNTKLDTTGDIQNTTVTFTGSDTTSPSVWEDFDLITSGESAKSLFSKISAIAKNLRFLNKSLGGFSFYPYELTQAQYDALPSDTKNTTKMIFIIRNDQEGESEVVEEGGSNVD